jgi:hypothetical protein
VSIECNKDGVKFSCAGDIGSGSVTLKPNQTVDKPSDNVNIELSEPVALTFSLKYLTNFCKASGLSDQVKLCLSSEVPLLVEYGLQENSYLRFYLAPKVRFTTLQLLLNHSNTQADWRRRVSESRLLSTQAACFQDRCGVLRRNGFDLHIERLSGSWFRRAEWRGPRDAHLIPAGVPRPRHNWKVTAPPNPFTSSGGISDKEINTVHWSHLFSSTTIFYISLKVTITPSRRHGF